MYISVLYLRNIFIKTYENQRTTKLDVLQHFFLEELSTQFFGS